MSKGLGHVGKAIEAILIAEPDNAFTIEDLCDRVYPGANRIEKKHRVSVIRAAKLVAKKRINLGYFRSENLGGTLTFFTWDNVKSYSMARCKADFLHGYRNNDGRIGAWKRNTENDLRELLIEGGRNHHLTVPGGAWWDHVELWKARNAGNSEVVAELEAKAACESEALTANLAAALTR